MAGQRSRREDSPEMREILSNQYVEALLFTAVMLLLLKINGRVFRTL